MKRIGIIAALPGELRPLVKGWKVEKKLGALHVWSSKVKGETWLAACGGMGANAATRAFAAIEEHGSLSFVISTGWAGSLRRELVPGGCFRVSEIIDTQTAEHFHSAHWSERLILVTTTRVANAIEKRRLAENYEASLVDMEAATVARLARARDIPFYCFKAVTDAVDDKLPEFNRYLGVDGQLQMARFVGNALLRPWQWPSLIRLERYGRRGAETLRDVLLDFLDERGYKRYP